MHDHDIFLTFRSGGRPRPAVFAERWRPTKGEVKVMEEDPLLSAEWRLQDRVATDQQEFQERLQL